MKNILFSILLTILLLPSCKTYNLSSDRLYKITNQSEFEGYCFYEVKKGISADGIEFSLVIVDPTCSYQKGGTLTKKQLNNFR